MYEIEFWNSIKESTHPEDYEAYLKAYPNGRFASLAKIRLERYKKVTSSPPPADTKPPAPEKEAIRIDAMREKYVVTTNTNVRSEPTTRSAKIGELAKGSRVDVTGLVSGKNWYRVEQKDGTSGYVYAPLLEQQTKPMTEKPVAKSPPPAPRKALANQAKSFSDCSVCPEMVAIPSGSFTMGDDRGDRSEKPEHRVTITRPFAIGRYEVTVGQWQACVDAGGCKAASEVVKGSSPNDPIRDVSWADAQDYVAWLSAMTGLVYRLPTEAEWEYAARGGSDSTYWWGNSMLPGKASCKDCGNAKAPDRPSEVGSHEPNPFGLHDMNGNVWEWVSDCWHRNYSGAPADGRSWEDENCTVRVIRSGSWRNDKSYVHSASRFKYDAYIRYFLNGFRVAKSL